MKVVIRTAYNNADYLILRELDEYFDINEKQESYLKEKLKRLHNEHRRQDIPRYLAFLRTIRKRMQNEVQMQDLRWATKRVQGFGLSFLSRLYADSMPFLLSLDQEQIKHLEAKLKEANEDIEERLALSPQEYSQERSETILDRTETWMGELSGQQKQVLTEKIKLLPNILKERLEVRKHTQERFIAALQMKARQPQELRKLVRAWMKNYRKARPAAYRRISLRYTKGMQKYMLAVIQMATNEQRQHLIEKLTSYEKLLESLL